MSTDCKFYNKAFFGTPQEERHAWCVARNDEVVPGFLARLEKHCGPNMTEHGFACTDSMSMGDVAVLTFLHSIVFNANRME